MRLLVLTELRLLDAEASWLEDALEAELVLVAGLEEEVAVAIAPLSAAVPPPPQPDNVRRQVMSARLVIVVFIVGLAVARAFPCKRRAL